MSGQANQARNFLLDAERMIQQRSVSESRQFRDFEMLCSMLLYTRVMEEITHIYPPRRRPSNTSGNRSWSACGATKETIHASYDARFPSLRTRIFIETKDLNALQLTELRSVLNDGTQAFQEHANSTFKDIFGLSESLMSLISRTTHAISLIEAHLTDLTDAITKDAIGTLERDIFEWPLNNLNTTEMSNMPGKENTEDPSFESTSAAVHTALIIYFQREIRHAHPALIQHFVEKTLVHLLNYERQTEDRDNFATAGICWAAFVIGCEATDVISRERIIQLLSRVAEKSGNGNFRTALQFVPVVWELRTEARCCELSWRQVLRASALELLLS